MAIMNKNNNNNNNIHKPRQTRRTFLQQPNPHRQRLLSIRGWLLVGIVTFLSASLQTKHMKRYSSIYHTYHPPLPTTTATTTTITTTNTSTRTRNHNSRRKRIAFSVALTSCPPDPKQRFQFLDAAAVLKHSVQLAYANHSSNQYYYEYDFSFIAIVHVNATDCVDGLQRYAGFQTLVRDTPLNVRTEIANPAYVQDLLRSGCCGERELLKLYAYTLEENNIDLVVQVDFDFVLLRPLDESLLQAFFGPNNNHHHNNNHPTQPQSIIHVPDALHDHQRRVVPYYHSSTTTTATTTTTTNIQAMFTRQYGLHPRGQARIDFYYMQGGFLLVRPNRTAFDEILDIVRQGHFQRGWYDDRGMMVGNNNHNHNDNTTTTAKPIVIQYPKAFGGETIQGLIPFYYGQYHPDQIVELNWCRHNTLVALNTTRDGQCLAERIVVNHNNNNHNNTTPSTPECIPNCRLTALEDIYSAHFTDDCIKLWKCPTDEELDRPYGGPGPSRLRLCRALHNEWHRIRHSLEVQRGLSTNHHHANNYSAGADDDDHERFYGHCDYSASTPEERYRPIDWSRVP